MHFLSLLSLAAAATAKVLVKYDADANDDLSRFGQVNYDCWSSNDCGTANFDAVNGNASLHFRAGYDDQGVRAAEVHKAKGFHRAEHHIYPGNTEVDQTYYMGYKVRWDTVGSGLIVFQFKSYHKPYAQYGYANIPVGLLFKDGSPVLTLAAIQKPDANPGSNQPKAVWSKALDLGTVYQFGIVINTSQSQGFLQVYFNGKLITMTDPYTGEKTQKLAGNFFPGGDQGAADPKIGMYGGNDVVDDGYIYDFVLADSLADIKSVAGIA